MFKNILLFTLFLTPKLWAQAQEIDVNPLQDTYEFNSKELSLTNDEEKIIHTIRRYLPQEDIKIHAKSSLQLADNPRTQSYTFSKDGIPVCQLEVKAIKIQNTLTLFGEVPKIEEEQNSVNTHPDFTSSLIKARSAIKTQSLEKILLMKKELCLFAQASTLKPVWEFTLKYKDLRYKVWADDTKIYKFSKQFFELKAPIQTYERDPVTNSETKVFEEEIQGDGTLSNAFFLTNPSTQESGKKRAKSASEEFLYNPGEDYFDEASLFVHANEQLSFFKSLGYTWDSKPIVIKFHTLIDESPNNAMYQPADSSDPNPIISVGDGDGLLLQNLALDADVVAHELGHHVIFENLTEVSGQSLILHEGLADYFVFAKNQDRCLGRSICPEGGAACTIPNQCLRIASEKLTYQSSLYRKLGSHGKGQLISGFLYGLNEIIDAKQVPQMVYNSLELLVHNSGFKHLVVALMLTDYDRNQGSNACKIYDAAVSRGFEPLLKGIDCSKLESLSFVSVPKKLETPPPAPKKKRAFMGCKGFAKVPSQDFDVGLLFFLFPVLYRRKFLGR